MRMREIGARGIAGWAVFGSGVACVVGALLHLVIAAGGPDWYAFFGAPKGIVALARAGSLRAPISCIVISAFLGVLAAYAFSAAGLIRRLPLLRLGLGLSAGVLLLRGIVFVPIVLCRPQWLAPICDCRTIDGFIVITSLICLAIGVGFAASAWVLPRWIRDGGPILTS